MPRLRLQGSQQGQPKRVYPYLLCAQACQRRILGCPWVGYPGIRRLTHHPITQPARGEDALESGGMARAAPASSTPPASAAPISAPAFPRPIRSTIATRCFQQRVRQQLDRCGVGRQQPPVVLVIIASPSDTLTFAGMENARRSETDQLRYDVPTTIGGPWHDGRLPARPGSWRRRTKQECLFVSRVGWRRGWDSNPRKGLTPLNGLANRRLQPLGHPSAGSRIGAGAPTTFAPPVLGPSRLHVKRSTSGPHRARQAISFSATPILRPCGVFQVQSSMVIRRIAAQSRKSGFPRGLAALPAQVH